MPPRQYDYDRILELYDETQNLNEVSKQLNVPWRSVYNVVMRRHVLPYTRKTVPPEMVERIIETYKRLKNMNAVAKELNITRQLSQGIINQHNGTCNRCETAIKPGEIHCASCQKHFANRIKLIRKEKRRAGICYDCDKPIEPPSHTRCAEHRLERYDWHEEQRRLKGKPARRRNKGSALDVKVKLQGILKSYGENGVRCFEEADGRCLICHRQHGDEAEIHVHHVNRNEKDHRFENLVCLCYEHHMAVHSILRSQNVPEFLDWVRATYVTNDRVGAHNQANGLQ